MMGAETEQRLDVARRVVAGYQAMLATCVATLEALGRLGGDREIVQSFEDLAATLRLSTKLAEQEIKWLGGAP